MKRDRIKMDGWIGKWYIIDEKMIDGEMLYLLEHETYGDETEHLIAAYRDNEWVLVLEDVWNGWLDLDEMGWY